MNKCYSCKNFVPYKYSYKVEDMNFIVQSRGYICPWCIIRFGEKLKADFIKSGAVRSKVNIL